MHALLPQPLRRGLEAFSTGSLALFPEAMYLGPRSHLNSTPRRLSFARCVEGAGDVAGTAHSFRRNICRVKGGTISRSRGSALKACRGLGH